MPTVSLKAHYDGKTIRLDEPFDLPPNTRLMVTVLPPLTDAAHEDWSNLSAANLARAYGDGAVRVTPDQDLVIRWVNACDVRQLYRRFAAAGLGLAEASTKGYKEHGRFKIADQGLPSWAHPVVAGARLYVRNQGTLAVYNVRAKG